MSVLENELKDGWVQYLISILEPVLPQNLFSLRIVQVSCPAPVPVAGHQCRLFIALQCDCFPHPLPSHYNRNCSRTMKYSTLCFATLSHLISCSSDLSINQMKTDQCTVLLALHRTEEVQLTTIMQYLKVSKAIVHQCSALKLMLIQPSSKYFLLL